MLQRILGLFGFWWGLLFGKKVAPITPGKTVSKVEIVEDSGQKYKVTYYTDGTSVREPYNGSDPTGTTSFLDGLPRS